MAKEHDRADPAGPQAHTEEESTKKRVADTPPTTLDAAPTPTTEAPAVTTPTTSAVVQAGPMTFEIEAFDFGFHGLPAEFAAGDTIELVNSSSSEYHSLDVVRLEDDDVRSVVFFNARS